MAKGDSATWKAMHVGTTLPQPAPALLGPGFLFPTLNGQGSAGHGAGATAPPAPLQPLNTSLASTAPAPVFGASSARVKVSEADRVAWMREFLSALEQWKTCLDSMLSLSTAGAPVAGARNGAENSEGFASATAAHQMQYLQQLQSWQNVRQSEDCNVAQAPSQGPRFQDSFRPMRLCKHFIVAGVCAQSEQCSFAHSYEELHPSSPDMPKASDLVLQGSLGDQVPVGSLANDQAGLPDLRLKRKKELCGRFQRGYCTLGKVCAFAHGEEELNSVGLAVCGKVKTQLCRNWEAGRCAYGANCNNAHGDAELGTKRPSSDLAPPGKRRRDQDSMAGDLRPYGQDGDRGRRATGVGDAGFAMESGARH